METRLVREKRKRKRIRNKGTIAIAFLAVIILGIAVLSGFRGSESVLGQSISEGIGEVTGSYNSATVVEKRQEEGPVSAQKYFVTVESNGQKYDLETAEGIWRAVKEGSICNIDYTDKGFIKSIKIIKE
jgi:hypothetical protein